MNGNMEKEYDLTQSQLLIWTGQKLNPEAPLYNMAFLFKFHGTINEEVFNQAFHHLVQESDSLRTIIIERDAIPRQIVNPQIEYQLEFIDWTNTNAKDEEVSDWAKTRSEKNFSLSKPMFDSVLVKTSEDQYFWFFNQHHLITDGWSVTVLYKRLAAIYGNLLVSGKSEDTFPLYENYISYEKQARKDLNDSSQSDFWKDKIKSIPAIPYLYGEKNEKNLSNSERLSFELGEERSTKLKELCKESDIRAWTQHLSLFNIFSTVLFSFLYRVSGQKRNAIGTPAHNRITPEFKDTSGLFIELFPLTAEIKEHETFSSLFKKIQWETSDFLKNAIPGAASNEISRGFNVVLNYINASFSDFHDLSMTSEWVHPSHADAAHVLRLQVHDFDSSGNLTLHFDVNTATFGKELKEEIPRHFIQLLDAFIEDRFQEIDEPALNPELSLRPLEFLNQYQSVIDQFFDCVNKSPQSIAIKTKSESLSFKELDEKSNQLAHYLLDIGLEHNENVAIHLTRSPELIISILAVLKAGGTFIPIDTSIPQSRVEEITLDAKASIVLTHSGLESIELPNIQLVLIDKVASEIENLAKKPIDLVLTASDNAYILYTSGSTGKPKGVMITHENLAHYISWAVKKYKIGHNSKIPLFSSIGFDLTITSIFTPLVGGATILPYKEGENEPDLAVLKVIEENEATFIKLTPSHLALLEEANLTNCNIETMIVGGEEFKASLANSIQTRIGKQLTIYNEYGPTEATVGCIVHEFDSDQDMKDYSLPIGYPIDGVQAVIVDDKNNLVPNGVAGQLYIGGKGVAAGYWRMVALTNEKFIVKDGVRLYKTGDLARVDTNGRYRFLGRKDEQIKIGGRRVELGEIENAISTKSLVSSFTVELKSRIKIHENKEVTHCANCGLPAHYPESDFNDQNICGLCQSFESYKHRVQKYFKTSNDLERILKSKTGEEDREYDCISLLSGGKDSTYALAKLIEMGLKVLAFTLDNGYISSQAKDNIDRVVNALGVDHMYGTTPDMNKIFVDSLQRHSNVCDGCFKTIYSLSMKVALEKKIPFIVTGLSRGQFFETRLTEELFSSDSTDINKIDEIILNARKAYHRVDDAVKKFINVSEFENDEVFEKVQFVDFYRFTDVSLEEMLTFLESKLPWSRPTDTGRSTNCLINAAGIYVHKKKKGFSNYAFPYSWDVRLGHKTRDESIDEINEEINEEEVLQILEEIGYNSTADAADELIAYYTSEEEIDHQALKDNLIGTLPEHMIPSHFVKIDRIPLNTNGKVDKSKLPLPVEKRPERAVGYVAPRNDIEEILTEIWCDVLKIEQIGIFDKFLDLGGTSLSAIRIISRANEAFELELPLNLAFSKPTIASFSDFVRETIVSLLEQE